MGRDTCIELYSLVIMEMIGTKIITEAKRMIIIMSTKVDEATESIFNIYQKVCFSPFSE